LSYDIKPFKNEVLNDTSPLNVFDVLLGKNCMWKCHAFDESCPHSAIVALEIQFYRVPEVVLTTAISFISTK